MVYTVEINKQVLNIVVKRRVLKSSLMFTDSTREWSTIESRITFYRIQYIQSATSKSPVVRVHKWFSSGVVESALNREKDTIMENNGGKWWCGSAVSTRASSTNESRARGLSTNHGPLTPHSATWLEGTSFVLSSLPILCSVDLLRSSRQIQRSS